jgi:hypothetical protein
MTGSKRNTPATTTMVVAIAAFLSGFKGLRFLLLGQLSLVDESD